MKESALVRILAFFAVILFSSGCISWIAGGNPPENNFALISKSAVPEYFEIWRPEINMNWGEVRKESKYTVRDFYFDSYLESMRKKNNRIAGALLSPRKPKSGDIFLIIPITQGDYPSDKIAELLASAGYYSISIKSGFRPMAAEEIKKLSAINDAEQMSDAMAEIFKSAMRQNVVDLMRLMDFAETDPIIAENGGEKKRTFHVIGLSLGGGIGSLLAAVDPRVQSLMTVISSAGLSRIILDSKFSRPGSITSLRDLYFEKFKFSYEEAYETLSRKLRDVEPLNYAHRLDPSRILMVSAAMDMFGPVDSVIPYSSTHDTWVGFGKPEWVTLLTSGHLTSFFAFFPGWIEIQKPHHSIYNFTLDSHVKHLIRDHFLPKALRK